MAWWDKFFSGGEGQAATPEDAKRRALQRSTWAAGKGREKGDIWLPPETSTPENRQQLIDSIKGLKRASDLWKR